MGVNKGIDNTHNHNSLLKASLSDEVVKQMVSSKADCSTPPSSDDEIAKKRARERESGSSRHPTLHFCSSSSMWNRYAAHMSLQKNEVQLLLLVTAKTVDEAEGRDREKVGDEAIRWKRVTRTPDNDMMER